MGPSGCAPEVIVVADYAALSATDGVRDAD
jgi:hypothetical protein